MVGLTKTFTIKFADVSAKSPNKGIHAKKGVKLALMRMFFMCSIKVLPASWTKKTLTWCQALSVGTRVYIVKKQWLEDISLSSYLIKFRIFQCIDSGTLLIRYTSEVHVYLCGVVPCITFNRCTSEAYANLLNGFTNLANLLHHKTNAKNYLQYEDKCIGNV